jgi:PAS domain S-box-containing protein
MNEKGEEIITATRPESSLTQNSTTFPAEDLAELLGRLHKRNLELEERNQELAAETLAGAFSDEQFNQLFDTSTIGCAILNNRGLILHLNREAAALFGSDRPALLGKSLQEFLAPEDANKLRQYLPALTGKASFSMEVRLYPPDRDPVTLHILGRLLPSDGIERRFRLLLADVTPLKQARSKILRLGAFPTLSPNPLLEFGEDGAVVWFNEAAQQLLRQSGCSQLLDVLPRETPRLVMECLATGKSLLNQESVVGARHIVWSFFPLLSSRMVHCYGTDMTERVNLEAQQRQTQRLESVGQLAANVAHDFNNIITIIQGYTSLLLSQRELPPEMNDPLHQISTASERATNLTRQLMIFSRKNRVEPRMLDLNELVQSFGYLLRRLLGDDIAQQFNFAPGLPSVQADPGMMEQIIMNLSINAREAMPKGGKLLIETSAADVNDDYVRHNPDARTGKFVRLSISDTGAGMNAETMSKIFEPFFTTKEAQVGLGLSAVYGIVKQHQGWIEVASEIGQGTTFKVYLPALAPRQEAAAALEPQTRGGHETVLVVEDEPALRELSVRQLRKLGYTILQASSGTEALSIWQQNADKIDLLFTDMVMPDGMTGRDLAETLLTQKPDLKIIYTSGYSLDVVEQDFALRKGAHFLQKPYPPTLLNKTIRTLLDS